MWLGQTLKDRFVLGRKLGKGTGGQLFEAFDLSYRNSVAVKFLSPRTFESASYFAEFVQDMEEEAARLEKFRDMRGIPNLLDQGRDSDGTYFIVMQKVDGTTLKSYAENGNSPMELDTAVCIVAQLCEILGDVHDRGYVHRDLKPENAMIDSAGQVHLIDLGHMLEVGTEQYQPAGTNRYAAPEQVHELPVATSADVFPLGCMLAEMITLALPYPENYLRFEHRGTPPPKPMLSSLAPHLIPLVSRMVSWDPERRPQNGWATFRALQQFLPAKGSPRDYKLHGADPTARYRAEFE
ncbi:serine/threonine protein kinase [Saccharothrix longispora]|uniref:non-specific serine/threonine protein kinase n=2 Tax=Saccharothrix longispora TaxID=33920 RepID=A0ABU1PM66_9PSEU|nr:serine/threonine-protein kinase [Saccharothrix longispora]MDR6591758.1 serine/threonine-protein kinase [Saccharothrix longispora]